MSQPPHDRSLLLTYGVLCLVVLGLVGLLISSEEPVFGRFLGRLPPLGVFAGVASLGGVLFATVLSRAGFAVIRSGGAGGWVWAAWAAAAFVAVHVVAINGVGLWLFWRYDFVMMHWFRLLYYLVWHVTWGAWRLEILF